MSGLKQTSYEEEQNRRAEAMRVAALNAARAQRDSALARWTAVCDRLPKELTSLSQRHRPAQPAGVETLDGLRNHAEALHQSAKCVAQAAAFLARFDPKQHAHTRADAARRLCNASALPALESAQLELSQRRTADAQEALHVRAHRLHALLRRCEEAGMPLSDEARSVADLLERYTLAPNLEDVRQILHSALQVVSEAPLEEGLTQRARLVAGALDGFYTPEWRQRLSEWRAALPDELATARRTVLAGDWQSWRRLEAELDALLWARARLRIDRVLAAARAQGFEADTPRVDTQKRTLEAEVRVNGALLALVREEVRLVVGQPANEWTSVRGPDNLSAEQCGALWLSGLLREAESTGATAALYVHGQPVASTTPAQRRARVAESA